MGYGGKQANRSGDVRRFNFTGNGSNTAFDLGFTPATQNQLIITVNGLVQHYDAFSISGSTINFTGTPASGDTIQVTAVVDAVGVAAIPDGAIANVSTLTVSGAATLANTFAVTGNAVFSNTVAITGNATFSNTVAIVGSLSTSTNTATFGTAVYSVANGNIGIGTNTPGYKVHALSASVDVAYAFTDTATSTSAVGYNGSGSTNGVGAPAGTMYMSSYNSVPIVFGNGNTERMRIDTAGRVTMPYQPAFWVAKNNGTAATNTDIVWNDVKANRASGYNVSNGRFTAPIAGYYFFSATGINVGTSNVLIELLLMLNGTNVSSGRGYYSGGTVGGATVTNLVNMAAGDYVTIQPSVTTMYGSESRCAFFSGYLIG
jgi:hypothetical protein